MEATPKSTPRDFFLHLLSDLSLYYCAVWLVTLWWQYIDRWYPAAGSYYGGATWIPSTMRWAIASLVIVFPVYILVTRYLNNDLEQHPEKRELKIRKWLMYLTLSLAAVTIIIDLVTLLFNLLEGDFTAPFILRVLSVLIVAAMVFDYYFYELRRDLGKPAPQRSVFRWSAIGLVIISVVGAFFVVGSPSAARQHSYDQQRVYDLQNIQGQVVSYWQRKGALPAKLADLNDPLSGFNVPTDPDPNAATGYEYTPTGPTSFQLCATFAFASDSATQPKSAPVPIGGYQYDLWTHGAGRQCFTRTIDPQLYPKLNPTPKR